MDRKPLYAQFDGDEVDGKRYALGDELDTSVDFGTVAFLTGSGRFAAEKPGETFAIPSTDVRPVADMGRAELLAELGAGETDDRLREAVEHKRAMIAERDADQGAAGVGTDGSTDGDPLAGNADAAIEAVGKLDKVEDLTALREREVAGKNRTTVTAAIDKRIEAIKPAE